MPLKRGPFDATEALFPDCLLVITEDQAQGLDLMLFWGRVIGPVVHDLCNS